jgi:hypothetical protein
MLSVILIAAVPAQAGTIRFGDVISLATVNGQSGRQTIDLRLRSVTQQTGGAASQDRQTSAGSNLQDPKTGQTPVGTSPAGGADANITGTAVAVQQPGSAQVETIELGDVQGTICDCGEIPGIPGGFPKLPFLALAGIPLLFLGGGGEDIIPPGEVIIIPTPTPPAPPQVPEPATLLLLGSGLAALGAGARRRRAARSAEKRDETLDARGA